MGLLDKVIGSLGLTVNPATGERVRTKTVPRDDWGNTREVVEQKDKVTGKWKETGDVPGSSSGGHY